MFLIASNSQDWTTFRSVKEELEHHGKDVVLYNCDQVANGEVVMSHKLSAQGKVSIRYADCTFHPEEVEAAWHRRAELFDQDDKTDQLKNTYLNKQRKETQDALWYSIPADRWLNAPLNMQSSHNNKSLQMELATSLGMAVPRTIVSNSWGEIFSFLGSEEIVLKMPFGMFYEQQKNRFLATTIVKMSDREKLAKTMPFPGIWQEYIPKKREWRVTVVGEKSFSAAIYTNTESRDDWRKHQFNAKLVQFKAEKIPPSISDACVALLRKLGLGYGAFDFIEKPDGTFVFLEVNTNGQYQWLVEELKLPIPQAIAQQLMAIASKRSAPHKQHASMPYSGVRDR